MNLYDHLRIRTPIVWVDTPDVSRHSNFILELAPDDVYLMDPKLGFSLHQKDDEVVNKPVLFQKTNPMTGETYESVSFDVAESMVYMLEHAGTMIIDFGHKIAEDVLGILNQSHNQYRKALLKNDAGLQGAQFIMFCSGAEIPPDLAHLLSVVKPVLPTSTELAEITAHIEMSVGEVLEDEIDISKVSEYGAGLSESEFIEACLLSATKTNKLDPMFINEYKMERIKLGGNLEIRRPEFGLTEIGGLDNAKKLIHHVEWMWDNPQEAEKMDLQPLRRMLLIGVQGSGKSAICEATAKTLDLDLAKTGVSQSLNRFIGQSEENMRNAFTQIAALAPIVCWIDEFGRDVSQGSWQGDGGTTSRVHGEFLTGLQELPDDVFLMAAANRIDHVATEMLRADRFDAVMFVGFPTLVERMEIFKIHLGERHSNFDTEALATDSAMFTGAEIKSLVRETRFRVSMDERRIISTDDILKAIPTVKNTIWQRRRDEVIEMYTKAIEDWDWASSLQKNEAEDILSGGTRQAKGRNTYSGF